MPATNAANVTPVIVPQRFDPAADIDSVREHPENPNRGDEDAIEASIDAHGFYGAVLAQESSRFIIAGNHRHRRMKANGEPVIPIMWVDVDDDEALRILLNDNTSHKGVMHDDTLMALLSRLAATDAGLAGTGFRNDDLQRLVAQLSPAPGSLDDVPALDQGTEHSCPYCSARWRDTAAGLVRLDQ